MHLFITKVSISRRGEKSIYKHTLLFKSVGSVRFFFFKEMNTCIEQGCIKFSKSESIDIVLTFKNHERNVSWFQLFSTLIIIRNVS